MQSHCRLLQRHSLTALAMLFLDPEYEFAEELRFLVTDTPFQRWTVCYQENHRYLGNKLVSWSKFVNRLHLHFYSNYKSYYTKRCLRVIKIKCVAVTDLIFKYWCNASHCIMRLSTVCPFDFAKTSETLSSASWQWYGTLARFWNSLGHDSVCQCYASDSIASASQHKKPGCSSYRQSQAARRQSSKFA